MNVNTLIQIAWRNSTLIDEEEEPTLSEAAAGLRLLNSLLRIMNVKSWWPWTRTEIKFKLSGQQEYTIGNSNVDIGTVTGIGAALYIVEVPNSSKYTVGTYINVRRKLTPQVTNGDVGNTWSCDVISVDSTANTVTFGLPVGTLSISENVYMIAQGELPDVVTFRPSQLSHFKYKSGNVWIPISETSLATWDDSAIDESSSGTPSMYRFLPNVPYAIIDFGSPTLSDYTAMIGYKSKVTEVEYSSVLEEIFPPEYISALEYMLASKILGANNRTEPQAIFQESTARMTELKRNNISVPVLEQTNRKPWYDYKSGMNVYG